jgi:cytochrome c oxidase cbb3-type subunit 3
LQFHVVVIALASVAASAFAAETGKGQAVFRSNCAFCHGMSGEGGRGPNLAAGRPTHGASPEAVGAVIKNGVSGTAMPSFHFEPDEMSALVTYVVSLRADHGGALEKPEGDPVKGRQVYQRLNCSSCHQLASEGSVFGPDLTRIGASRSLAYLRTSITDPSADIPSEYEGVRVVTKAGAKVSGVRLNEDTFSLQLRDFNQEFRMFDKSKLAEVAKLKQSLMPAFNRLPASELNDLLAYLDGLRGQTASDGMVKKAPGIK